MRRNGLGWLLLCGVVLLFLGIVVGEIGRAVADDLGGLTDLIPLEGIQQISAGGLFTCALTTEGGVKCWGDNHFGKLGNGTNQLYHTTAVDVEGLTTGVTAISAGGDHACAITMMGGLKCWGNNRDGQLGNGLVNDNRGVPVPVDVVGLTNGVAAVVPKGSSTCALTTVGGVKCWGNDTWGVLGNGELGSSRIPTDVVGLTTGVAAIAMSGSHACALTTEGSVKCWGYNFHGELGDGTRVNRETPVDVVGLPMNIVAIAAGAHHNCVLTVAGGVICWGYNEHGELGNGEQQTSATPVDVVGLSTGVTQISSDFYHTCVFLGGGVVKCWGRNLFGELGDGTSIDRFTPVTVTALPTDVTAITTGGSDTCALISTGRAKCWGFNVYGEVGDGTTEIRTTPVDVMVPIAVTYTAYFPLVTGE